MKKYYSTMRVAEMNKSFLGTNNASLWGCLRSRHRIPVCDDWKGKSKLDHRDWDSEGLRYGFHGCQHHVQVSFLTPLRIAAETECSSASAKSLLSSVD
jgi:hypothetical protein